MSLYAAELSTEDIDALFVEYHRTRCRDLRNRLVEAHLPIAERCARRYANRGEPLSDLLQVARMALVGAVERYDPARGIRFESFAVPTVLGKLRHHFRDSCWIVYVPRRDKDLRPQVFSARDQISQQLGRQPTAEEIAEALEIELDRVVATLESNGHFRAASYDAMPEHAEAVAPPPADEDPARTVERVDIVRLIDRLDERLRQIVVWRFYEQCTQREIGDRLGIGQVQVSRLLNRTLDLLRSELSGGAGDQRSSDSQRLSPA